jgi:hypothetical protein
VEDVVGLHLQPRAAQRIAAFVDQHRARVGAVLGVTRPRAQAATGGHAGAALHDSMKLRRSIAGSAVLCQVEQGDGALSFGFVPQSKVAIDTMLSAL